MGLRSWFDKARGTSTPDVTVSPPAPDDADIVAALARVDQMLADGNAPPFVVSRVRRIAGLITDTLPRLRNLGQGSFDSYSVVATATDYLPAALGGYLRLPRDWADTRPIDGYKTALMVLIDQLELLAATMEKILDAATRSDAQALIAHGQFLQAKFAPPTAGPDLDLGPG